MPVFEPTVSVGLSPKATNSRSPRSIPEKLSHTLRRLLLVAAALTALSVQPAMADVLNIYIDVDDDPATGCGVATPDGPFDGAELAVLTDIDTTTNQVTGVSYQECDTSAIPPSFGPPVPHNPGGWAIGIGLGAGGSDVIETFLPLDLVQGPVDRTIRLGYAIADPAAAPGSGDAVLSGGAGPLRLLIPGSGPIITVPALPAWGILALSLILALSALAILRRRPGPLAMAALAVTLTSAGIGLVWAAITPDGDPSDWNGIPPLATDPIDMT